MQSILTLLAALLPLAMPASTGSTALQERGPTPEQIEQTLEDLKAAFSSKGELAQRISALQAAAEVPDKAVVKLVAKALGDKETTVQVAAIESLRHLDHPDALDALHNCYRRDRKLVKDPERAVALFRAIGHHGSPKSVDVLSDDPFSIPDNKTLQARILALGNIRSKAAVEELIGMMNKAGQRRRQPHMDSYRLALARLTGADHGKTYESWLSWWNDSKGDLEVSPQPPKLTKVDQMRWDQFWGNETTRERKQRRGERGDG